MIGFVTKLLGSAGGWQMYAIIGVVVFSVGLTSGGYAVHKFYQAGEVGSLKAEISRRDKADKDRNQVAADLAAAQLEREQNLLNTIKGLENHAETLNACLVDGDVGRMLNQHR